jgi:superfamily II DNA or RNA helicase
MVVDAEVFTDSPLADLKFQYPLRRYQKEILELVNIKLERGEKQLHIVAPPGAGKTIIGLQIISQFQCNSLIVCPNTTIQAQWAQKLELFFPPDKDGLKAEDFIGTHEDRPLKPITCLTYQVLSTPGREQEYLEKLAHQSWVEELTRGLSLTAGEAELRILELLQNNKPAYSKEISRHTSRLRRRLTEVLDLNDVLHKNALDLLQALRRQNFNLVLFDECHHLTDYWAAVMTHLVKRLKDPAVFGLTGTPPEGKSANQETRYLSLVGEIDYQVPTPALVKEAGLAPFQDLVYFTTPTPKETVFLETQHEEFHALLNELTSEIAEEIPEPTTDEAPEKPLPQLTRWVVTRVAAQLESGKDADLLTAFIRYLWKNNLRIPREVELNDALRQSPLIEDWMLILEDYCLHSLKLSADRKDHELYERIKASVRKLGYGITEQGVRRQASPVDRVLAYSEAKAQSAARILETEYRSLQDRLRAIIVTDFERMTPTAVRSVKGVLDTESGGAIASMREVLASPVSQFINPCLVTGSLLLVDKRVSEQFRDAAQEYVQDQGYPLKVILRHHEGQPFDEITGGTSDWETRLYVGMATALFERGITKCLVGTRGIFGEGWDSQSLNTLIDLTTATSAVSVKQLRGRSIRLHTNDPLGGRKVANNWDVVCIAPDLEKGLNDYERFVRKHDGYFGMSDDGQIECGAGHVHPALSELTSAEVFVGAEDFNSEMLERALVRDQIYEMWKVGEPYSNRALGCIEIANLRKIGLTPPHIRKDLKYKVHSRHLRAGLNGVWWEYLGLAGAGSATMGLLLALWHLPLAIAVAPLLVSLPLARRKYRSLYARLKSDICQPNTQESSLTDIALAVLISLQEMKLLPRHINRESLRVTVRASGHFRVFLDDVEPEHSQYFAKCFRELMQPVTNQPYLIPKYEYSFPRPRNGEDNEEAFFRAYLRGRAEPRIGSYHPIPKLLARSEKGRECFQAAWNKYVSPGFVVATETKPELLQRYFGMGPSLAQRLLWE